MRVFAGFPLLPLFGSVTSQVKPESKLHLLTFRKQAGIDAQEHILALEKQGWTVDDYEVGVKGVMSKGFAGRFNSSDRAHFQGDKANTLSATAAESKTQENVAQGEQRQEQQQHEDQSQEGQEERDGGAASNPIAVPRKLPVPAPRPIQRLQRQRIAQ